MAVRLPCSALHPLETAAASLVTQPSTRSDDKYETMNTSSINLPPFIKFHRLSDFPRNFPTNFSLLSPFFSLNFTRVRDLTSSDQRMAGICEGFHTSRKSIDSRLLDEVQSLVKADETSTVLANEFFTRKFLIKLNKNEILHGY